MLSFWLKQTADQPLFTELLWSRPENKRHAGKLLIVGGNSWGFNAPASAYAAAEKVGIGTARVLLPEAVLKVIGHVIPHAESAASTPSGSFSKQALAEFLQQAQWADGVLLAGDLGRNSETAILCEQFLGKYAGPVVITKDAVDYFITSSSSLKRTNTTLVLSLGQLQKLAQAWRFDQAITSGMDLVRLVERLHELQTRHGINLITKQHDQLIVAADGQVSTTRLAEDLPVWRVEAAAHAAVWWLQNPTKAFEALTTSLVE